MMQIQETNVFNLIEHRWISASIMNRISESLGKLNVSAEYRKVDQDFGERFFSIRTALFNLMKYEKVNQLRPHLLTDSISDQCPPEEKAYCMETVDKLRDLSLMSIAILGRLEYPGTALKFIDHAR